MRSPARVLLSLGFSLTAFAAGATARADTSAWVFAGGGVIDFRQYQPSSFTRTDATSKYTYPTWQLPSFGPSGALTFDAGVGTTPDGPVIIGGLVRVQPLLGSGTDVAVLARLASHGFQAGGFGIAVDAGSYMRFWGPGSVGFTGDVTFGAPLGFQLSIETMVGTHQSLGFGAVAGVDLLRLTLYRQTMLDHWQNPSPAWKRLGQALGLVRPRS